LVAAALLAALFVIWFHALRAMPTVPGAFKIVSADQLPSHLGQYVEMKGVFRDVRWSQWVENAFSHVELQGLDHEPDQGRRVVVAGRLILQHGLSEVDMQRDQEAPNGVYVTPGPYRAHFALQDTEVIAKAPRWWPF